MRLSQSAVGIGVTTVKYRLARVMFAASVLALLPGCGDDNESVATDAVDSAELPDSGDVSSGQCYAHDPDGSYGEAVLQDGESNDGDVLCDSEEEGLSYEGVPCDTVADCDGDGWNDAAETLFLSDAAGGFGFATSMINPDTDSDGIPDPEDDDPTREFDTPPEPIPVYDGRSFSYLSGLVIAGEDCCFSNLDDDAAIDNDFVALIGSFANLNEGEAEGTLGGNLMSRTERNEQIQQRIESGEIAMIVEFDEMPKTLPSEASRPKTTWQVEYPETTLTLREAGFEGETTVEERRSGDGEYTLGAVISGPIDALAHPLVYEGQLLIPSADGLVLEDVLDLMVPSFFETPEATPRSVSLDRLRVRGDIFEQTSSDAPEDQRGVASVELIELGGAISLQQVVDYYTAGIEAAFPEFTDPALVVGEDADKGRMTLNCTSEFTEFVDEQLSEGAADAKVASGAVLCEVIDALVSANLSVDSDEDGFADSLAIGLMLELSGAANTVDSTIK